jgi:hypothetical protein
MIRGEIKALKRLILLDADRIIPGSDGDQPE